MKILLLLYIRERNVEKTLASKIHSIFLPYFVTVTIISFRQQMHISRYTVLYGLPRTKAGNKSETENLLIFTALRNM